ncbi:hypothetical protein BDR03DRAFT_976319 [Suillus americanus]|nr:hypothetical protein BDR03DRAFT_976319 [Suillus americanus]
MLSIFCRPSCSPVISTFLPIPVLLFCLFSMPLSSAPPSMCFVSCSAVLRLCRSHMHRDCPRCVLFLVPDPFNSS